MCYRSWVCVLVLAGFSCGCASESGSRSESVPSSLATLEQSTAAAPDQLTESLFKEDQKVISNEDIQKILSAKLALPPHGKIAVIRAGLMPRWLGWSEDFTHMSRQSDEQLLEKIRNAPHVREAVYLPTMAIPHELTIPYLRQAAARFQADLVLVYRTYSRTYDRQRLFSADQTRAYCTLEALLIDTRTGVIPFSAIVTQDFSAERSKSDVDFSETIAKAEQQAIAKSQLEMAEQLVRFMSTIAD